MGFQGARVLPWMSAWHSDFLLERLASSVRRRPGASRKSQVDPAAQVHADSSQNSGPSKSRPQAGYGGGGFCPVGRNRKAKSNRGSLISICSLSSMYAASAHFKVLERNR